MDLETLAILGNWSCAVKLDSYAVQSVRGMSSIFILHLQLYLYLYRPPFFQGKNKRGSRFAGEGCTRAGWLTKK